MPTYSLPIPTLEQEYYDIAIAHSKLRSARIRYHRVLENAQACDPTQVHNDVSVYYCKLQVKAAEAILDRLVQYYGRIHPPPAAAPAPSAPLPTRHINTAPLTNVGPVIEIEDSDDEQAEDGKSSSPSPAPAYSSWPPTPPHFYSALVEEGQLSVPSTPTRRPQGAGQLPFLLSPPPCAQPRQTTPALPMTPRHITTASATIIGENGVLTSPQPQKKHYIVTRGRRTGIYRAWPLAHGYIDGIASAAWQGFDTYQEAFDAYMSARERGLLSVIRLPSDTVAQYGPVDAAEDL